MAVTLVTIVCAGRYARIGVLYEVPRAYMILPSHRGSCDHGCHDQCSRQQFKLGHTGSPSVKSQRHLAPWRRQHSFRRLRATELTIALLFRINWRLGRRLIYSDEPRFVETNSIDNSTFA